MGIGLGIGINRSNYAQGIFNAYNARVVADGGITEAGNCVNAVTGLLLNASLLIIPSGYKGGKAYAEIPTNGNADLTWTRASTALRTNSSGLLESMGSGVPRLSYMYGSCPALLLEPQRTNLALYSEQFDNSAWVKLNTTVTSNSTTAPDGNSTADTLTETVITDFHQIGGQSLTNAPIATYTLSVYVKLNSGTRNIGLLPINSAAAGNVKAVVFSSSGAFVGIVGSTGTDPTYTSTSLGNGWYRLTATASSTSIQTFAPAIRLFDGTAAAYLGSTSNSYYIWGAQIELGAYATTLIPTTTASATRIADSFSRNNIYTNGLITSSGGTWFVELRGNVAYVRDSTAINLFLGDNITAPNNAFVIRTASSASTRLSLQKVVAGSFIILTTPSTDTLKIAFKWNGTSADVFVNGVKEISATAFTTTNMEFLSCIAQNPTFIQQMALFNSALTDAQCQTLTT